ncbi:hypothetical protein QCA50_006898 [Cerrena zonata]|uniref:T6SS Phospholipase effector Tle1-like catalytic domain-containing protein n=1 Tax=Cerrena zonata TaxID=2478898 RepID=A0AAW0GJ26_9APHY
MVMESKSVQSGPQIEQDLLTTKHASSDRIQRETSPNRGRSSTDPARPTTPLARPNKRIIICCDGTWQDGLSVSQRWKYTNIIRLARAINRSDERTVPPTPQIVFYQTGVGTDTFTAMQLLDGAVGATLGEKVQEAYGFLAHNYQPGDEIFLFGFSRGAYTARTVAAFIGAIGILDRRDMDHFAEIFLALQKRGMTKDDKEISELDETLKPWIHHDAPGRRQVKPDGDDVRFTIKCVGVFDTVGSVGLPDSLTIRNSKRIKDLFGFPDRLLGHHIARAYHAVALNENRKDFKCAKFHQTDKGKEKGQTLKQCWFAGSHSDIGGGYEEHDLAELSLFWMAANIEDILSLDLDYLISLRDPVASWGAQSPHDSSTGIFSLTGKIKREIPIQTDEITNETIHLSVLQQPNLDPALAENIRQNPSLIAPLLPLEEQVKAIWQPSETKSKKYQNRKSTQEMDENHSVSTAAKRTVHSGKHAGKGILKHATHKKAMTTESGQPVYEKNGFGKAVNETSVGLLMKEILKP